MQNIITHSATCQQARRPNKTDPKNSRKIPQNLSAPKKDLLYAEVKTGFFHLPRRTASPAVNQSISRAAKRLDQRRGLARVVKGRKLRAAGILLTRYGLAVAHKMAVASKTKTPEKRLRSLEVQCRGCGATLTAYYAPAAALADGEMLDEGHLVEYESCNLCEA